MRLDQLYYRVSTKCITSVPTAPRPCQLFTAAVERGRDYQSQWPALEVYPTFKQGCRATVPLAL